MNTSTRSEPGVDSSREMLSHTPDNGGLTLADVANLIRGGAVRIAVITISLMAVVAAVSMLITPLYTADGLVQVETEASKVGGSVARANNISDLLSGTSAQVDAETQILGSRLVLGRVISKMNLLIGSQPRYFPVVGKAIARMNRNAPEPVQAVMGLSRFAWGGEEFKVGVLELPASLEGRRLTLRATGGAGYSIEDSEGTALFSATQGQEHLEQTPFGPVRILVEQLKARAGTEFYIQKRTPQDALGELAGGLKVLQQGKDSGVIKLTYTAAAPDIAAVTVNNVEDSYLEQNIDRRSAVAQSSLDFLGRQIPDLRKQVASAQQALNDYQKSHGSVDITKETEQFLRQTTDLETQRINLIQQRDQAVQHFTAQHPTVKALDEQIRSIRAEQDQLKEAAMTLPKTQQDVLGLIRDLDVANQLYTATLNSLQELEIQKAGTIGNVRIVDRALVPLRASSPNKKLIVLFAMVMGLVIGIGYTLLRHSFFDAIDDPWLLEKSYGLPTFASVPFSRLQQRLSKRFLRADAPELILAKTAPTSPTIEAIKSLRSALHFASEHARNNVIMLTGPSPGLGKSFVTMNLGAVLAAGGSSVVVVDCDLRRGQLSLYAQLSKNAPGLSDLMLGQATMAQCTHVTSVEKLNLIPIGTGRVLNSADLLMGKSFENLLEDLSQRYDHVLVDTPPVLALTDAAIIGRRCGTTLMVLEAGQSSLREVIETCRRLEQTGTRVTGVVFNKVSMKSNAYGYGPSLNTYYNYI